MELKPDLDVSGRSRSTSTPKIFTLISKQKVIGPGCREVCEYFCIINTLFFHTYCLSQL